MTKQDIFPHPDKLTAVFASFAALFAQDNFRLQVWQEMFSDYIESNKKQQQEQNTKLKPK